MFGFKDLRIIFVGIFVDYKINKKGGEINWESNYKFFHRNYPRFLKRCYLKDKQIPPHLKTNSEKDPRISRPNTRNKRNEELQILSILKLIF